MLDLPAGQRPSTQACRQPPEGLEQQAWILHSTLVQLAPTSPDLNPIENVWSWMEAKVDESACTRWADFKAAVHMACKEVPQTMVDNLY